MEQRVLDQTLDQVQAYLEVGDLAGAIALIEALRPPDQADVFEELRIGEQEMLLPRLDIEDAADILEELEDEDAAELASLFDARTLAPILDQMATDEAADLLGDLQPKPSSGPDGRCRRRAASARVPRRDRRRPHDYRVPAPAAGHDCRPGPGRRARMGS